MVRLRLCLLLLPLWLCFTANAVELYVAVNGSDSNPGTREKPLASLSAALRKARELRRLNDPSVKEGIHILMNGGWYPISETIILRAEDAGTNESPTYIEST